MKSFAINGMENIFPVKNITRYSNNLPSIKRIIVFLLINLLVLHFNPLHCQDKTFMTLVIKVENMEEEGIDGVTAKLFEKGNLISTVTTFKDGNALFKLNANSEYTIEISKASFVSKIISVNTKIPKYEDQVFETVQPVLLFKPCEGLDYSILSTPVVKLVYFDVKRDFLPEKAYAELMAEKLDHLMKNNDDCNEEKFQSVVRKADRLFVEKKYTESRETYIQAKNIRSDDKHVLDRIDEIDEILAQQKDSDKTYKEYIAQADKQLASKNYPLAKEFYKRAQSLKPAETYPPLKIAEIDKILAQKDKEEKDKKAQQTQQEQQAQQALEQKAKDEQLAKEKQAQLAKEEKDKQAALAKAEEEKQAKAAIEAEQNEAKKAQLEKEEKARQAQLAKEEKEKKAALAKAEEEKQAKLALEAELNQEKQAKAEKEKKAALAKAEEEKQAKLALEEEQRQAKLAILEKNKKDSLAKVDQDKKAKLAKDEADRQALLAKEEQERKDKEARFQQLIKQGDNAFESDACGTSLKSYRDALAEKPNDAGALKKIADAEKRCKENQAKAAQDKSTRAAYNAAIAEGDKLLAATNYTKAKESYQKAAQLLSDEPYPGQKIKEIDNILKAKDKEEQALYKKLMADANKAFDNENLPQAKDLFNQILKLRPDDQYSKDKIQAIDSILAEQKRLDDEKKAKQEQYNKIIADADAAFKKPDFTTAKAAYQKALTVLPSESYPKQKLGEIDGIEKEQVAQVERDYNAKIQSGDRNFASKNYTQALQDYQDAKKIKPAETYPSQRIDDINKVLADQARIAAEQKAKQDAYNAAIVKADNFFKTQQYDQALVAYKEASSYKPEEQYPFTKADEIAKLKKQLEADAAYKKAIASANALFDQKKFEQSKSVYAQALEQKPNDAYAIAQIAKADKEIADQIKKLADSKARQEAYDKALADADKSLAIKDYDMAKTSYQTALTIFPDKPLPKQKITEIDNILKEKKRSEDYRAIVDEANTLLTSENYEQAKAKYKAAAAIKPEETFPGEKIKEIDKLIALREADKQKQLLNEKNYNDAIKKANDLFDKALYAEAKKEYERSLTFMPNESYPKQKIAKIDEINKMLAKEAKQTTTKTESPKSGVVIADLKFKNDNEREVYLKELLAKYPPGITCEVYKEKTRIITRYIIVRENAANDFREIKYNWGGVDFTRNDKPITLLYFNNQIRAREGEYFNKTDM